MCGLITLFGRVAQDSQRLQKMSEALKHRGPDGTRFWSDSDHLLAMAHARLSIIDLELGWQPLHDKTSGLTLVFNGEIYNYRELRTELLALGETFFTESDSEVLLKAFKVWREDCLRRLNGMFAFCIYDSKKRSLFFARDPVGIKPLYYANSDDGLMVTSELRALLKGKSKPPQFSSSGLLSYLNMGYVLAPQTIIEDVWQLPAGHYAEASQNGLMVKSYFDPAHFLLEKTSSPTSYGSALEETKAVLSRAIERQLVSDVPIGTFLSGGVDSSLVTKFARDSSKGAIEAFTMDFAEVEFSEAPRAQATAKTLGVHHHLLRCSEKDFLTHWRSLAAGTDAPIFDNSFLPTSELCRQVSQHVKVALSGDGGDELFLGYETYQADHLARTLRPFAGFAKPTIHTLAYLFKDEYGKVGRKFKLKAFARSLERAPAKAHCGWREILAPAEVAQLLPSANSSSPWPADQFAKLFSSLEDAPFLSAMSVLDLHTWLSNDILVKADRASMMYGLEVRVPL